jgi:hypothetical protein
MTARARFGNRCSAVLLPVLLAAVPADLLAQRPAPTGNPAPDATRVLLAAPGGDTLAIVRAPGTIDVVGADGDWVRVRIEGWLHRDQAPTAQGRDAAGLADLRANPDRYAGTLVRWRVQNLGLQRADSLRSDMTPGEAYLLTRDPGGEAGFVYVTVPQEHLRAATELAPLQRVEIVGRVRVGRSPLTGHPILDLVELLP